MFQFTHIFNAVYKSTQFILAVDFYNTFWSLSELPHFKYAAKL